MSRRARRRKQRQTTLLGATLGGVAVATLAGIFIWGALREDRALDAANCPIDGQYAAQVAILVDPSDSLTVVQRSVASRIIQALQAEASETAEIRIYALARAGRGDTASALRLCVPRDPASVSSTTGNPAIARRRYDAFTDSLHKSLTSLLNSQSDNISPLIEGIQVAAVSAFQPRNATLPRHLFIVSDMLQHSPALSFYPLDGAAPDFGKLMQNPDYGTLRVDLSGVEVSAFLLARGGGAGRRQAGDMQRFWEEYFVDQGADPIARPRWVNVEG